eukprot:CAMPEP_0202890530 /NCGR_PEP_ID=MMETSP1392-20130828/902_1 /ASSEMBLY_ACC=CAM_ASM_000868 /TAXON_ID=225041 /ORGANISM="Chlamydomonas chlamydogama, Strain SAG 11-48b" /LENGTH=75 /DNA_ID=CAMNT_0049574117 /DNA_START=446 /DNA_END=673 /DNA_ORIENTATION=-
MAAGRSACPSRLVQPRYDPWHGAAVHDYRQYMTTCMALQYMTTCMELQYMTTAMELQYNYKLGAAVHDYVLEARC